MPTPIGAVHQASSAISSVRTHHEPDHQSGAERGGDGDIDCIAAPRDQHPADPRNVIAWIEDVPSAAEICLEPAALQHKHPQSLDGLSASATSGSRNGPHRAIRSDDRAGAVAIWYYDGTAGGPRRARVRRDAAIVRWQGARGRDGRRRLRSKGPSPRGWQSRGGRDPGRRFGTQRRPSAVRRQRRRLRYRRGRLGRQLPRLRE
jgi:hypothetical protein